MTENCTSFLPDADTATATYCRTQVVNSTGSSSFCGGKTRWPFCSAGSSLTSRANLSLV